MPDPISPEYRQQMNVLAVGLDAILNGDKDPKTVCFVLLISEFNQINGRVNYISNADRNDTITMMKEVLARFQGQPEQTGHA